MSSKHCLALILILSPFYCLAARAEEWSPEKPHYAPTEASNRIIKWCEINGEKVRYSSANIALEGYEPCGQLAAQKSCDPIGKRYITKGGDSPYSYRDCAVGPRIFIQRHGSDSNLVSADKFSKEPQVSPLSPEEEKNLKTEIEKLAKNQREQNPILVLEQIIMPLLTHKQGPPSDADLKQIEKNTRILLKSLDPQTKQLVKQILGPDLFDQFIRGN